MSEEILISDGIAIRGKNSDGVYEEIGSEVNGLNVNIHRAPAVFKSRNYVDGVSFDPLVSELPHSSGVVNFGVIDLETNVFESVKLTLEVSLDNTNWGTIAHVTVNSQNRYHDFITVNQARYVRLRGSSLDGDLVTLYMSTR